MFMAGGRVVPGLFDTGVVGGGKNDSIGTIDGALTGADVGGPGTLLIAVVGGIGGMCGMLSTDVGVRG